MMFKFLWVLFLLTQLQAHNPESDPLPLTQHEEKSVEEVHTRKLLDIIGEFRLVTPGCDPTLDQNCSAPQEPIDVPDIASLERCCTDTVPIGAIFDCIEYAEQDLCDHLTQGYCEISCGKCCEDVPLPGTLNCSSFEDNSDLCSNPTITEEGYCQQTCGVCGVDRPNAKIAQQSAASLSPNLQPPPPFPSPSPSPSLAPTFPPPPLPPTSSIKLPPQAEENVQSIGNLQQYYEEQLSTCQTVSPFAAQFAGKLSDTLLTGTRSSSDYICILVQNTGQAVGNYMVTFVINTIEEDSAYIQNLGPGCSDLGCMIPTYPNALNLIIKVTLYETTGGINTLEDQRTFSTLCDIINC